MDNPTQNDMPEYVKNLPQAVQDLVFDGVWEDRTEEISKKYSLNDAQTDALINTTLFVLIGLQQPETFLETIIKDLGISRLLAEQIVSDLETRVFEYALKQVEGQKSKVESKIADNTEVSKSTLDTKVTEVKPANLPMIEPGEIAHSNPPPRYIPTSEYPVRNNDPQKESVSNGTGKPISVLQENKIEKKPEQVQQPVPVPRFVGNSIIEERKAPETPAVETKVTPPQNMMDNKLSNVVKEMKVEVLKQKPPEKYTTDPYREPIE